MSSVARPPSPLGDVEVRDVWSREVGDTFRLFLGRCGPHPEAVLFVSDGNGLFGITVDTVRLMQLPALVPSLVVVGIGYPGSCTIEDTVDIRVRDLTPSASRHFPGSGGADAFLRFVGREVVPMLERDDPACLAHTVYFGHSLGGLLGVHALLGEPAVFHDHIVSSPSLWWDHRRVFEAEQRRASAQRDLVSKVFVGIGALETDEGRRREAARLPDGHRFKPPATYLDMVDDVRRLAGVLRERTYPGLDLEVVVFDDEYHATVAGAVLARGLRHVFEQP